MKKLMKQKSGNKGFTLAELLIVVAIIAVLVAIAIPIFMKKLEVSRESTDAANARSAYAEIIAASLDGTGEDINKSNISTIEYTYTDSTSTYEAKVKLKQVQDDWQSSDLGDIAGTSVKDLSEVGKDKSIVITYKVGDEKAVVDVE